MNTTTSFFGDEIYSIECTGDAVVGDIVRFEKAIFSGHYKNPKFLGFELISGEIVSDSYGKAKQQHTFTLRLESGDKLLIKGRILYKNRTWRKAWEDEQNRKNALNEKHARGDVARKIRSRRRSFNRFDLVI